MDSSQASTSSNDNDSKLYLNDVDILFLVRLMERSKGIVPIGREKLEEIYHDIAWYCKHNIDFDAVGTYKEIKSVIDIINKFEDIEEEISEGITLGYITKKDHPKTHEKLTKYREFLEQLKRLGQINEKLKNIIT